MILRSNLPRLIETALASARVLDVGGWHNPFGPATHVIDLGTHETRRTADSLTPGLPERFTGDTWLVRDVCAVPWPYPDKFFDFALASHVLEDVRDPLAVCRELVRVARRGYVEVPSRAREIFSKARLFRLKAFLGDVPEVGFYHHRWLCEIEDGHVRFMRKTHELVMDRGCYIARAELGRKMTEAESGRCLWWEGGFTAEEVFAVSRDEMRDFKRRALAALRAPREV